MNHKNAKTGFETQIWLVGARHVIINIKYAPQLSTNTNTYNANVSHGFYMIVNITFLESYRFNIMDE